MADVLSLHPLPPHPLPPHPLPQSPSQDQESVEQTFADRTFADQSFEDDIDRANALSQQAIELYQQGRYTEAVPLVMEAIALEEGVLGPRHPEVANSL
ncbi:MAG: tetratricopeptide repeat protein, partial [Phormidesmis sp.]